MKIFQFIISEENIKSEKVQNILLLKIFINLKYEKFF